MLFNNSGSLITFMFWKHKLKPHQNAKKVLKLTHTTLNYKYYYYFCDENTTIQFTCIDINITIKGKTFNSDMKKEWKIWCWKGGFFSKFILLYFCACKLKVSKSIPNIQSMQRKLNVKPWPSESLVGQANKIYKMLIVPGRIGKYLQNEHRRAFAT